MSRVFYINLRTDIPEYVSLPKLPIIKRTVVLARPFFLKDYSLPRNILPILNPFPSIPDRQHIKCKSYNDQKFVIRGWIRRQSNQIEAKKKDGDNDICPAIHRIL